MKACIRVFQHPVNLCVTYQVKMFVCQHIAPKWSWCDMAIRYADSLHRQCFADKKEHQNFFLIIVEELAYFQRFYGDDQLRSVMISDQINHKEVLSVTSNTSLQLISPNLHIFVC